MMRYTILSLVLASAVSAQKCFVDNYHVVVSGESLGQIASDNGVSLQQVEEVNKQISNPDLIYPNENVNLPNIGCAYTQPSSVPSGCVGINTHVVQSGETLTIIAQQYGLTNYIQIVNANPVTITNPDYIEVHQAVNIPSNSCPTTRTSVPSKKARAAQATTPTTASPTATCTPSNYTVVAHDTLTKIAAADNVTLAALEAANPQITNPDLIFVGQVIKLPCPCQPSTYTIASGDGLYNIATAHNVTLAELEAANPQITNPDLIYPGENITIPCPSTGTPTTPVNATATCVPSGSPTYIVQPGDTLTIVARGKNITLASLEAANPQITNVDLIYANQTLAIPICGQAPVIISTPTCVPHGSANTYTAKQGDTYGSIAAGLNITPQSLEDANPSVPATNIPVGQVLNVPVCAVGECRLVKRVVWTA